MGITAIEIAEGKPPYSGLREIDIMSKIQFDEPPKLKKTKKTWDESFEKFISSCLIKDPSKRPTAKQIKEMNRSFFAMAKDNKYISENLLKGVPNILERVISIHIEQQARIA